MRKNLNYNHLLIVFLSLHLFSLCTLGLNKLPGDVYSGVMTPQDTICGPSDPSEIETFFDMVFKEEMEKLNVPGATFSLVKNGKILFIKGYVLPKSF